MEKRSKQEEMDKLEKELRIQNNDMAIFQDGMRDLTVNLTHNTTETRTLPKALVLAVRFLYPTAAVANAAMASLRRIVREASFRGHGPLQSALLQLSPPMQIVRGSDLYEELYHHSPSVRDGGTGGRPRRRRPPPPPPRRGAPP